MIYHFILTYLRITRAVGECHDTAGFLDAWNNGCGWYEEHPEACGWFDGSPISKALSACCVCQNGDHDAHSGFTRPLAKPLSSSDVNSDIENIVKPWTSYSVLANGNLWSGLRKEAEGSSLDCLLLLTHGRVIRHCPKGEGTTAVIFEKLKQRIRGVFVHPEAFLNVTPGSDDIPFDTIWILVSPQLDPVLDQLWEVAISPNGGEVIRTLTIPNSGDAHDMIRYGGSVFVADTRHGHIIELELPQHRAPKVMTENAKVRNRYHIFGRKDHINNLAVSECCFLVNLHGSGGESSLVVMDRSRLISEPYNILAERNGMKQSKRRAHRGHNKGTGGNKKQNSKRKRRRKLLYQGEPGGNAVITNSSFDQTSIIEVIDSVGSMVHGITFTKSKLLSLDSSSASLVSVNLETGLRKVLWETLGGVSKDMRTMETEILTGANFAKGLALQGDLAYFGISAARAPNARLSIPTCTLVAFNVSSQRELWRREVPTEGLLNQVVVEAYLLMDSYTPSQTPQPTYMEWFQHPTPSSIWGFPEGTNETCNVYTEKNNIPLAWKPFEGQSGSGNMMESFLSLMPYRGPTVPLPPMDNPLAMVTKKICHVDVSPIRDMLLDFKGLGSSVWDPEVALIYNGMLGGRSTNLNYFKPGVKAIHLIFSDKAGLNIYYFPWWQDFKPLIMPILEMMGIQEKQIVRLQFALMSKHSDISSHVDQGNWVLINHRVHIPIYMHEGIHFLVTRPREYDDPPAEYLYPSEKGFLRVRYGDGDIFEMNNAYTHKVHNYPVNGEFKERVHIIFDWAEYEHPNKKWHTMKPGQICWYQGRINCDISSDFIENHTP